MRVGRLNATICCCILLGRLSLALPAPAAADDGYESLFDGQSLANWDGNPDFWRVEDGTITGETTAEKPTKPNTFLIWRGGEVGNFELTAEFNIRNHNTGIQYRSFEVPDLKWVVGGYQADIDADNKYTGSNYGERFRGMLGMRGLKTVIGEDHKAKTVGSVGDPKELAGYVKPGDWNEYTIIADGFHFVQKINGHVMSDVTDEDTAQRRASGILALQLHAGPPMKVQFRNIRLKRLKADENAAAGAGEKKKIALIAGKPSHGYGAHEHRAGCMLLAKALNASGLPVQAEVYTDGWPADPSVLNAAATIVIYCDGGAKHPFSEHLAELNALMHKGVGLVCIHYAVEAPKAEFSPQENLGASLLDWTGGYFEPYWSVNPHWTADYKQFPDHPISRGVKPFSINDEWYYHMRFRSGMDGVTPILATLPPESSLSRPDGPHSGNADVRAEVKNGQPQYMSWARQRPDGGRGFGFTGGHDHWNWGNNDFRKLVLNAIVWTAKVDVPAEGVSSQPPTVDELLANLDKKPIPANFNPAGIQAMLDKWNGK